MIKSSLTMSASVLLLFLISGCGGTDGSQSKYEKCISEYEKNAQENGGNGGILAPEDYCQGEVKSAEKKEQSNDETNRYLIGFKDKINTDAITSSGAQVEEELPTINVIVAELTGKQAKEIEKHPDVKYIEIDGKVHTMEK